MEMLRLSPLLLLGALGDKGNIYLTGCNTNFIYCSGLGTKNFKKNGKFLLNKKNILAFWIC